MDVLHKLLTTLDHNRWAVGLTIVAVMISAGLIGCQPETQSLVDPQRRVSADELAREASTLRASLQKRQAEVTADTAALAEQAEIAEADIMRQMELRKTVIETLGGIGTAVAKGSLDTASGVGAVMQLTLLAIAGGGVIDRRRKDDVIDTLKSGATAAAAATGGSP